MGFRRPGRLASFLIGASLFTAALAAAATLATHSGTLGAGSTTVDSCTAGLRATYSVAWDSTTKAFRMSSVTLSGDTTTCAVGGLLTVDLGDSSNNSLYEFTHTLVSADVGSAAAIVLAPSTTVAAASVRSVFANVTG